MVLFSHVAECSLSKITFLCLKKQKSPKEMVGLMNPIKSSRSSWKAKDSLISTQRADGPTQVLLVNQQEEAQNQ